MILDLKYGSSHIPTSLIPNPISHGKQLPKPQYLPFHCSKSSAKPAQNRSDRARPDRNKNRLQANLCASTGCSRTYKFSEPLCNTFLQYHDLNRPSVMAVQGRGIGWIPKPSSRRSTAPNLALLQLMVYPEGSVSSTPKQARTMHDDYGADHYVAETAYVLPRAAMLHNRQQSETKKGVAPSPLWPACRFAPCRYVCRALG